MDVPSPPPRLLHEAILQSDLTKVYNLIEVGADINQADDTGQTPLHLACRVPYFPVTGVVKLLEAGADIDREDLSGHTPLHIAAGVGRYEVVRVLLDQGADMHKKSTSGRTSLFAALLINPSIFLFPSLRSGFPTARRIREDKLLCACVLLKAGFDLKHCDDDRIPILVRFIGSRYVGTDMLAMLLSYGADANKAGESYTPLMMASMAAYDRRDYMTILLEHGADINGRDCNGNTALHLAASFFIVDSIHFLIDNGADVHLLNVEGFSFLDKLPINIYVKFLLDVINKINVCPSRRKNLECPDFIKFISDFESGLEATPLLIAVWQGKKELALRLLDLRFLTRSDILWLPGSNKFRDKLPISSIDSYDSVVTGPCPLRVISFVAVSEMLGNASGRQIKVKQLGLPIPVQEELLFKRFI